DLGGVGRQLRLLDAIDELAALERTIADDRDLSFPRERQDVALDLAVDGVVGDLDEVDRLRAHDLLGPAMATALRGRDSDEAELAGLLHAEERLEMLLPGFDVVDLEEIEARDAPQLLGLGDLRGTLRAGRRPDFVGGEEFLRVPQLPETIAN